MVFQSYALYPHKTVRQNMGFALKLRHIDKAEVAARVDRAAAILGLAPLLDRYPRQLSGGQRQRVAMGRAIVRDPQVFLFDEPLSQPRRQAPGADARRDQGAAPAAADDDGLRHPRPDRGDDHGRQDRGDERRPHRAGRRAARALRPAGQPLRRRVHRLAVDEPDPRRRARRRRRGGRGLLPAQRRGRGGAGGGLRHPARAPRARRRGPAGAGAGGRADRRRRRWPTCDCGGAGAGGGVSRPPRPRARAARCGCGRGPTRRICSIRRPGGGYDA